MPSGRHDGRYATALPARLFSYPPSPGAAVDLARSADRSGGRERDWRQAMGEGKECHLVCEDGTAPACLAFCSA